MVSVDDIVITGLGCVTPLGIGREAFEENLLAGKCAIRQHMRLDNEPQTTYYAALVDDFDGKRYVKPRKALKVMSREVQMAYSAAHIAWQDAGLEEASLDPDRIGVVYGSEIIPGDHNEVAGAVQACSESGAMEHGLWGKRFEKEIFPLWMLKNLPNMPACHVGIAVDARGPNNTIAQEEVSGLLALSEAVGVIARGQTDMMVVGSIGNRTSPTRMIYRLPHMYDQNPADASSTPHRSIPFSKHSHGIVPSEGSVAMVIENRRHAVARGAQILGRVAGYSSRCGKPSQPYGGSKMAIASAATSALSQAGINSSELNHVCAQGFSNVQLDSQESAAISEVCGDTQVSAFSSYFGTAGAGCGLMELAASLSALRLGKTLGVLEHPGVSEDCRINLCRENEDAKASHFLKLSFTPFGQASAVAIECSPA